MELRSRCSWKTSIQQQKHDPGVSPHNEPIVYSYVGILVSNISQKTNLNINNNNNKKMIKRTPVLPGYILKWYFLMRSICSLVALVKGPGWVRYAPQPNQDEVISFGDAEKKLRKHVTSSLRAWDMEDPGWKQVDFLNYESWRPLCLVLGCWYMLITDENWLVVSTPLKNISQIGNLPQIGVKKKHIWNHHLENNDGLFFFK